MIEENIGEFEHYDNDLRVLVISHSYLDAENQKNIVGLARYLNVMAMVPQKGGVLLSKSEKFAPRIGADRLVDDIPTVRIFSGQFLFWGIGNLHRFNPRVVLVEYNPWSLVFVQAWLYRRMYWRDAMLVCFIKKNTYRRYSGIQGRVKALIREKCLGAVDLLIAGSRKASAMLQKDCGVDAKRIRVATHLGVDENWFIPRDDCLGSSDKLRVGYCGRMDPDKGIIELIVAVEEARKRTGKRIELHLLGDGLLKQSILEIAKKNPWVQLFPPVQHMEVVSFLQKLDIFVLFAKSFPDHEEHDAQALIEAFSCGLACIGTRVGIVPEVMEACGGVLIDNGDTQALVDAIGQLVLDDSIRRNIGVLGREAVVREFSINMVAQRKARLLRELVEEKG